MRVGIDGTIWPNRRGFGRYSRNVVTRLVGLDEETDYVMLLDRPPPDDLPLPEGVTARVLKAHAPHSTLYTADRSRPLRDLGRFWLRASRERFDAFVFPCVDTWYPVAGTPTVVGLYDDITDEHADVMLPTRRARFLWRNKQGLAVRRAARLFTISEASRQALSERLGIDGLAVLPAAPDAAFHPRGADELERELAEIGLRTGEPFVLYAGGIGPHKGLETLLAAWEEIPDAPLLVMAGAFDDPGYAPVVTDVLERAARLPAARFTGFLSDDALARLYTAAAAVVVPSLAEGFGLPAVEAAACGAPLVLSDIPPHRETLDGAAHFFPAGDHPALRRAVMRVLGDAELSSRLGRRAASAAARLSWERAAAGLRELVHEAAG